MLVDREKNAQDETELEKYQKHYVKKLENHDYSIFASLNLAQKERVPRGEQDEPSKKKRLETSLEKSFFSSLALCSHNPKSCEGEKATPRNILL